MGETRGERALARGRSGSGYEAGYGQYAGPYGSQGRWVVGITRTRIWLDLRAAALPYR